MPIQNLTINNQELKEILDSFTDEQETLTIDLSSDNIAIDDADIAELCKMIATNGVLIEIRFENASISPFAAQMIFSSFMKNSHYLNELYMPIWKIVNSNGQGPLMVLQEQFTMALEHHNNNLDTSDQESDKKSDNERARKKVRMSTGMKKRYTP